MGKKKRQRTDVEKELVYAKKWQAVYSSDVGLTALCALHLYARKNKARRRAPSHQSDVISCCVLGRAGLARGSGRSSTTRKPDGSWQASTIELAE